MSQNSPTFRLFKKMPSFANGVSSCLDFFGDDNANYKFNKTEKEADWDAIHSDWQAVGDDLKKAYELETSERK
jgi:hypothetical protein